MNQNPTTNSGRPKNIAVLIFAYPLIVMRDLIARGLDKIGITPNMLTVMGAVFTILGAYALARGAEQSWSTARPPASFWAACWFYVACAMDMLDGALARVGNRGTPFGSILDSTTDRISDMAIYGGIALAFGRLGNPTFAILALVGMTHAVLISYIKARSECIIPECGVGYWQRGERMVAVLVACFAGHVGTLVVMMALLPAFTVSSRLWHIRMQLRAGIVNDTSAGREAPFPSRFRWRRGSPVHVLVSAVLILTLAFVRIEPINFLEGWLW